AGISYSNFPSLLSIPINDEVNAFVQDPMENNVLGVTGNLFSRSRKPYPLLNIILSFFTTATAKPTAFLSFNTRSNAVSNFAKGSAVFFLFFWANEMVPVNKNKRKNNLCMI